MNIKDAIICHMSYVICIIAILPYSTNVFSKSKDYIFDPSLVKGSDVSRFNDGQQLPGIYIVNVFVHGSKNKNKNENHKIEFHYLNNELSPKLKKEDLILFNVNPAKLKLKYLNGSEYIDFEHSDIKYKFSFYGMNLVIYTPLKSLMNKSSELAHESQWEDGINALILNYDAKWYHRDLKYKSPSDESYYLSLNPGINIEGWRLRNSGIWRKGYDGKSSYQSSYTYAEKDIRFLKSKILIGESSTNSAVFDSIPFTGVKLATSDSMIPFYERTFVPTVRGVVSSVAQVEVRQNGYLIYSTEVPGGSFELTDIPAAEGENLDITVLEDNGTIQRFIVPYNKPAISLKEGRVNYEFTLGEYRPYSNTVKEDNFGNLTLIYGFSDFLTWYAGLQLSDKYKSGAIGLGFNLYDFGAVSLDSIYSDSENNKEKTGSAVRVRYNKLFSETNTSFNFASYQYVSEGYRTFSESMERNQNEPYARKKKNDTSISVRQNLLSYGALDLSLNRTTYWDKKDNSYISFNYSTYLFSRIGLSVGWNRIFGSYYRNEEDILSASVSIPLGTFGKTGNSANLRYQIFNEHDKSVSNYASLNGMSYDNRLSWNINQGVNSKNHNNNRTSASTSFKNSFGTVNGMYNYSPVATQYGGGITGSMVLHSQGITLGQRINGAAALVDVNGVKDIDVTNRPGVKTDRNGFALVTSLNEYRKNYIHVKQANLKSNVDIKKTVYSVVPTSNALVLARYNAVRGGKALFNLKNKNNTPVPFGAVVSSVGVDNAGIVGDDGEVYLSGLDERGVLKVKWGGGSDQECKISYSLKAKSSIGFYKESLRCE